jgi:hypothetical protein
VKNKHTKDEIAKAKTDVRNIFRAGKSLNDLNDLALAIIGALAEAELRDRNSRLAIRGLVRERNELLSE